MPKNPPDNMPRITANVFYDDLAAALQWLGKAFGFEKRMAVPGPDGRLMHGEMTLADGVFMLSPTTPMSPDWKSPRSLGGSVTQTLYVYVDGVDGHCARARAAGAAIVSEPEDMFWGDRTYVVKDLEGHRWTFAEHVRDVAPEDMHP